MHHSRDHNYTCLLAVTTLLAQGCATTQPVQTATTTAIDATHAAVSTAIDATHNAVSTTVDATQNAVAFAANGTEKIVTSTAETTRDVVTTVISPMRSAIYRSEFGDVLKVTYSNRRATLSFNNGTTLALPQIDCTDGFKYQEADTSLWSKDKKIILDMKGDKTEYTESDF